MTQQRNVAILLFEEIEVLDFAGPLEVFNVTAELNDPAPFNVYTVAETHAPIKTRGKLNINPNYSIYSMPPADILIVPGGAGSRALLRMPHILTWLREQSQQVDILASVCTGALVLGKAGLLDGLHVTTHHENLDELRQYISDDTVIEAARYVDNGNIITSGGIAAGIDMSLYLVRKLLGDDVLAKTTREMEYTWTPDRTSTWHEAVMSI